MNVSTLLAANGATSGHRRSGCGRLPHPEWGETVTACLVLRPGFDPATDWLSEVRSFLRGRQADYKLPRDVVLLDALPRNASGKVLKLVLRDTESLKGVKQA